MNHILLTAITVLALSAVTVFFSTVSAYLIAQTKKVMSFSNVFKVYSQSVILMIQFFIAISFIYRIELAIEMAKESSSVPLDTKYIIIILGIGLAINALLIVLTIINLSILIPVKQKKKMKAFIKKYSEKLPKFLRKALSPVTHKVYLALKNLAIRNCDNLIEFLEEIKPSDNDDNVS